MTRDLSSLILRSLEILDSFAGGGGAGGAGAQGRHQDSASETPHPPPGLTFPPARRLGNAPSAGTGVPEPGSFLPFFLF